MSGLHQFIETLEKKKDFVQFVDKIDVFLKKDNQKKIDKVYMELALNLARENVGLTGPNPSVGCVIVKNNEIISFGQTSFNGRPHAEYNAILSANKSKLKDSTMYVSLEPCTHFGKTDPCTDLIIKSKIKKLFYAHDDIDYRTSKRAEVKLIKGQVKVIKNFLSHKAKKKFTNHIFTIKKITYHTSLEKLHVQKTFFQLIRSKIITNEYSRSVSHLLRYKNQGILSTSKSSNSDNSRLDCRLNGLNNKSPKIFIIDKNLNINHKSNIVKNAKKIKTFIFYNKENKIKKNCF